MINRRGFTLFELLIVVVILTIVIGLIAPRFRDSIDTLELTNTVYAVKGIMERCVVQAQAQGIEYQLIADNQKRLLYAQKKTIQGSWNTVKSLHLPTNVYIIAEINPIIFYPNGTYKGNTIYVVLADAGYSRKIEKALLGKFSLGKVQSLVNEETMYAIVLDPNSGRIEIKEPGAGV